MKQQNYTWQSGFVACRFVIEERQVLDRFGAGRRN